MLKLKTFNKSISFVYNFLTLDENFNILVRSKQIGDGGKKEASKIFIIFSLAFHFNLKINRN